MTKWNPFHISDSDLERDSPITDAPVCQPIPQAPETRRRLSETPGALMTSSAENDCNCYFHHRPRVTQCPISRGPLDNRQVSAGYY